MCAWCAVPLCSSLRAGRFSAWHRYEQLGEALHSVHGMLLLLLSLLLCARRVLVPVLLRCTVLLLVVLLVLLPPPSLAMERVGGVLQLQPSPPQSPPSVAMERVGVLQLQSPPPQLPPSVAMERMGGVLLLQSPPPQAVAGPGGGVPALLVPPLLPRSPPSRRSIASAAGAGRRKSPSWRPSAVIAVL